MKEYGYLEGLLFIVGDEGLNLDEMKDFLNLSKKDFDIFFEGFQKKYDDESSGIALIKFGDKYKLITKKENFEKYKEYFEKNKVFRLTDSSLEVLAIVAYNEPITKPKIEEIRGVNSDYVVRKLLALDLIIDCGKDETLGRPTLYKTTDYFLDFFGITSKDELPVIESLNDEEIELFNFDKQ